LKFQYLLTLGIFAINLLICFKADGQPSFVDKINHAKNSKEFDTKEQISNLLALIPIIEKTEHNDTLGFLHYYLKFRYDREGQLDRSSYHRKQAITNFNLSGHKNYMLANMLVAEGKEQIANGLLEQAFITFESVDKIKDQSLRAHLAKIESSRNRAIILNKKGNYSTAVDLLEFTINQFHSSAISDEVKGALYMDLCIASNNIRNGQYKLKAKEALYQFKKCNSDSISQKFYKKEKEVRYLMQKAFLHVISGEHQNATSSYLSALHLKENNKDQYFQNLEYTFLLNNIAETYNLENQFEKALHFHKKAQEAFNFFGYPGAKETESNIYAIAADAYLGLAKIDSATYYIDKAISIYSFSDFRESPYKKRHAQLTTQRAEIYNQAFQITQDSSYVRTSFDQVNEINEVLDYFIQDQLFESSANLIKDTLQSFFNLGAELSYKLNKPDEFWNFSEKSKGLLLLNAIQTNQVQNENGLEPVYNRLTFLRKEQTDLELLLYETESNKDSLEHNLSINKKEQLDITRQLHSNESLKKFNVISLRDIEKNLIDQSIIHYQFTDSLLFAITVHEGKSSMTKLGNKKHIIEKIQAFRNAIEKKSSNLEDQKVMDQLSFSLYEILIEPLPHLHDHICIIPDQELNFLPFEALVAKPNSSEYLLFSKNISYSISGSLRQDLANQKSKVSEVSILNPSYAMAFNNKTTLSPLPFATFESESISEILSAQKSSNTILDKALVTNAFSNSDIIHFSGHAILDHVNPEFSFLALSSKDKISDRLSLAELYLLKNHAQMVVLSACNTGIGKILNGEGVSNLTRGFFYGGAQSVIQTLWTVNEKSTATILIEFYKNIKMGQSKNESLRNAKIHYLNTSDDFVKHPYYWAGIVPMGNMEALQFGSSYNFKLILSLFCSVLILLLAYRYVARRKFN